MQIEISPVYLGITKFITNNMINSINTTIRELVVYMRISVFISQALL